MKRKFLHHPEFRLSRRDLAILLPALAAIGALLFFLGRAMLRFVRSPEHFSEYIDAQGLPGVLFFCLLIVIQTMSACIPSGPFCIAAGFAFGAVRGALICDAAAAAGSAAAFALTRRFGVGAIERRISKERLLEMNFLKENDRANAVCFFLFLIPATPKDLLSYFAGVTDRSLLSWIFMVLVARFPVIFLSTFSGSTLGGKHYGIFAAMLLVTAAAYAAGTLLYRRFHKKNR